MFRRVLSRFRPSPAMVVAFAALVVALGGVAYATIPDGAVIHGCYTTNSGQNSGNNPTGALRVVNTPGSCASDEKAINFAAAINALTATAGTAANPISVPVGSPGPIVSKTNVPAGSYVINAKTTLKNTASSDGLVECVLGPDNSAVELGAFGTGGDQETIPLQAAVTLANPTTVSLECAVGPSGGTVEAFNAALTLVPVAAIS